MSGIRQISEQEEISERFCLKISGLRYKSTYDDLRQLFLLESRSGLLSLHSSPLHSITHTITAKQIHEST